MRHPEERIRESLPLFMEAVFHYMQIGSVLRSQNKLLEFIQHGSAFQLILGFRGFGKSYLTSGTSAWYGFRDPVRRTLCRSGIALKAQEWSGLSKAMLYACPFLEPLRPIQGSTPEDKLKKDGIFRYDYGNKPAGSKDPSVTAYGISGMAQGSHPHQLFDDDLETKENSSTIEARKKLHVKMVEAPLLLLMDQDPKHVVIGTYQTEDSVYKLLEATHEVFCLPCRFPHPSEARKVIHLAPYLKQELALDPSLANAPTCPERFNEEILTQQEAMSTASEWALQMLLDPTLSDLDRYPLRLKDLMVMNVHRDEAPEIVRWDAKPGLEFDGESPGFGEDRLHWAGKQSESVRPYQSSIMYVDPAGKGKDETGYCCAHLLSGNIFVSASGGLHDGSSEASMTRLAQIAKAQGCKQIIVEPNYGDGMYSSLMIPIVQRMDARIGVQDGTRATGQKEKRMLDVLEPAFGTHRIILDPKVAKDLVLLHQITRLTRDRGALDHDDRVEALSGAVAWFTQTMGVDAQKKAEEAKKIIVDREQKLFEKKFRTPSPNRAILATRNMAPAKRKGGGQFLPFW